MSDNNVRLTLDNGPHLYHTVPDPAPGRAAWYECFDFGSDPVRWVVLGWVGDDGDNGELECVEAFDNYGLDAAAALRKFAQIVAGVGEGERQPPESEDDPDDGATPQSVADEDFRRNNPHDGDREE